ncbi:MAG: undecaprenyl-phosphate glucose phosphotransferase [Proteobacteria bacterium]|nr:undecaprenyl-phosphate glucose phosphotransferase [Pseudomonadota bacterium]
MNRSAGQLLFSLRLLADLVMITVAWILAYILRFHSGIEVPLGVPPLHLYSKLIPFILGIWLVTATFTGMLRRMARQMSLVAEMLEIIPSAFMAILLLIAFTYFYEEYRYSRITFLIFGGMQPFTVALGRFVVRNFIRSYRGRMDPRRVLIIARGQGILDALKISSKLGIQSTEVMGIILAGDGDKQSDRELCQKYEFRVIEEQLNWAKFFAEHPTQTVVVALPYQQHAFLDEQLEKIADQVNDIRILPDIKRFSRMSPGIEMIDHSPVISIHESPLYGINCILKRGLDILGASLALLIFSPIMLIIAIIVPFSSRGPILYRQERMGLDGIRFLCLKFRSMPIDAEQDTGAIWANPHDQRATPFGSFLRRTSLDELPQFFNVLRGDMSLVGPRPERPVFVDKFRMEVPGYMLRHKVKTGITGWAQVNGWRGSTSIEKRIECDLFYIQNWSLWLDIKILFMTLDEVIRGRNAY